MAKFEFDGALKMERLLEELGPRTSNKVGDQALRAGAKPIVEDARRRVSVQTGALRDAIGIKLERKGRDNERSVSIGIKRPVSSRFHFLEFGTAHSAAKPFLRPAFESNLSKALSEIRKVIARGLRREAEKLAKGRR